MLILILIILFILGCCTSFYSIKYILNISTLKNIHHDKKFKACEGCGQIKCKCDKNISNPCKK